MKQKTKTTIRKCRECGIYELPNGLWGDESSRRFVDRYKDRYDIRSGYCPECKIMVLERHGYIVDNKGRVLGVKR